MINQPPLFFNQNIIVQISLQKHLEMFLDNKFNFSEQVKTNVQKTNETKVQLRKLQTLLHRPPLVTIYKSFISPHLDYDGMVFDQTFNMSFQQNIGTIDAIRDSSTERLYQN